MTPKESVFCGKIVSIQRGRVVTEGDLACTGDENRVWTSAFRKTPLQGPVSVTAQGIDGDEFGNPEAHGGIDKAVLMYAFKHYKTWQDEYPNLPWGNPPGGGFGENLTIVDLDETNKSLTSRVFEPMFKDLVQDARVLALGICFTQRPMEHADRES